MPFENGGDDIAFPHRLPVKPADLVRQLDRYPVMDSLTLDFVLAGVRSRRVGVRGRPDVLAVSLSTTDAVGHDFGLDSREMHDQVLRLDRWLGSFLDSLATIVPRDRTIFVLTSDHGMTPTPEYTVMVRHQRAGRVWLADIAGATEAALEARFHSTFDVTFDSGILTANLDALRTAGANLDSLAAALAEQVVARPGIARAYTARTLASAPADDELANRWRRTLPSGFGWLVCAVPMENYIWDQGRLTAQHGNAQAPDVGIPIAFVVPGVRPSTVRRVVRSVDIAPTLAALLGVTPSEVLDGVVLPELVDGAVRTTSR
jgi:arylsulfatase A-like enzyme